MKKIGFLLALAMLISSFAGLSVYAEGAEAKSGVIFNTNFESETVGTKAASMHDGTNLDSPDVSGATTYGQGTILSENSNKYVIMGTSDGSTISGADHRIGARFKDLSTGILTIEFDAKIVDTNMYLGLRNDTPANTWVFGATPAGTFYSDLGTTSIHTGTANTEWKSYNLTLDLTNGTSALSVDGVACANTGTFTKDTFHGFLIYKNKAGTVSFDNVKVSYNPVSATVYIDEDFEGTTTTAFTELAVQNASAVSNSVVNKTDAVFAADTIYTGFNDLGNKVWSLGHGKFNKINITPPTTGKLVIELDALVGNGGFGIGFGSSASGGGINGRYPFVYQRATQTIIGDTDGATGGKWYDAVTDAHEAVYTVEGTDSTALTYIKNRWIHIILEINTETGDCVATVDGIRSNVMKCEYIKNAPITSIGFAYALSSTSVYEQVNDKTAYIDNIKVTHIPTALDIKNVNTRTDKILLTFDKNIAAPSAADITLDHGAAATAVEVSGNKMLITADGLVDGQSYVVTLDDSVAYADGTSINAKDCYFVYKAGNFAAKPVIITDNGSQAAVCINTSLEDKTIDAYLAAYISEDVLENVTYKNIDVSKYDFENKAIKLAVSVADAKTVKAFAWDNNMVPYDNAAVKTFE